MTKISKSISFQIYLYYNINNKRGASHTMKKINEIKLAELKEFCLTYEIDHTLSMKMNHDLKFGFLEEETLNYIWNGSQRLRDTLITKDATPTSAELKEAQELFKTRIYAYLENGVTLTETLTSLRSDINETIYHKRKVLQQLSEKNGELFTQNLLFQSLSGFQQFLNSKRFLDIMKYSDYDEWISKRNRLEYELSDRFREYIEVFGMDALKQNKELYKTYFNNLEYVEEPFFVVDNGRFAYCSELLEMICRFKHYEWSKMTDADQDLYHKIYQELVGFFKKSNRSDYFQRIVSNPSKPFTLEKSFSGRVSSFLNHVLDIELAKIERGYLQTHKEHVFEIIEISKLMNQPKLLEKAYILYHELLPEENHLYRRHHIGTSSLTGNISDSRKIKYPEREYQIFCKVCMK